MTAQFSKRFFRAAFRCVAPTDSVLPSRAVLRLARAAHSCFMQNKPKILRPDATLELFIPYADARWDTFWDNPGLHLESDSAHADENGVALELREFSADAEGVRICVAVRRFIDDDYFDSELDERDL
jgi:hypothetical protein